MARQRPFDVIVYGATGFTGTLVAQYLAEHAGPNCRWALAGRNRDKLTKVRASLGELNPACAELDLVEANSDNPASLDALAQQTRVLISTVGPYLKYGDLLVGACAGAGTDYVDLTGEPEFVDRMYVDHHATAVETGARLVHACGFDAIPHDLGVFYTMDQLADTGPGTVQMRGVVRTGASFSGGTYHSAMTAMSRPRQMRQASQERRRLEREQQPRDPSRCIKLVAGRPRRDPYLGYWLLPLPTIDPQVVGRSAAQLPQYGPDFTYSHYAGTKTLRYAIGGAAAVALLAGSAQIPPVRKRLLQRIQPGQGPSASRREKSWFTVDFVATTSAGRWHTRVSGGDPGYTETAKMLAESALSLAFDDNPVTAGHVTPAVAMGEALLGRLQAAGIGFETIASPQT